MIPKKIITKSCLISFQRCLVMNRKKESLSQNVYNTHSLLHLAPGLPAQLVTVATEIDPTVWVGDSYSPAAWTILNSQTSLSLTVLAMRVDVKRYFFQMCLLLVTFIWYDAKCGVWLWILKPGHDFSDRMHIDISGLSSFQFLLSMTV